MGEEVCGWWDALDGGGLDAFFPLLAEDDCLVCLRNSAVNSWASLDLRPTLLKGLTDTDEEEREEKPVLIRSSVFSLRREPALWKPEGAGPFRGTVYCWVGGMPEAADGTCLSPLEPFLAFSGWTLGAEGSGGDVLPVKDWERFFRRSSSKNSITKAWWGSAFTRPGGD